MSDYIVTGRTGENHVTAADAGALNACFAGEGRYVAAGVGEALAAEVISNNCVRIKSGEAINQGRHMRVSANTYVDCTIQNGSQSTKRYDLIVFRYTKNAETDIEKAEIVVIKGTAGSTAADPTYTAGNILAGARQDDMPLYRVRINGINIEAVDKLFTELPSLAALNEKSSKLETAVSQLNSESTDSGNLVGNTDICTSVSFSVEIIGKIAIVSINATLKATTSRLNYVILALGIPQKYIPKYERYICGSVLDTGEMVTDNQFLAQVKSKDSQYAGRIYLKSKANIIDGYRVKFNYVCEV